MVNLTAAQFIDILNGEPDTRASYAAYYAKEPGPNNTYQDAIKFTNVEVSENIKITGYTNKIGHVYIEGAFLKNIHIENCIPRHQWVANT